ncbi:SDR family oxidoreductase [Smaragdicoccus niigatensis]
MLQSLADEISAKHGVTADVIACDLADAADRAKLIEKVHRNGRHVDVLVNSAGFATGGRYVSSDADREVEQVRVLVEAPVALTSAFLPGMVERHQGAILNVASTAGLQPMPWSTGYSAAKAHTVAFSQALSAEVRREGITVTALCPGPVKTDFWEVAGDQPIEKAMPRLLWRSPAAVAKYGIKSLDRGHRLAVPGLAVRLLTFGGSLTPTGVKLAMFERSMRP